MSYKIRTYGDPVLKTQASKVENVDGKVARLVDDMFETLIDSGNGLALAAPQIGVQKQVVVCDFGENPLAIVNPEVIESDGEWVYDEGCLSIPELYVEMVRPKQVLVRGVSLDGEIIEIEEVAGRCDRQIGTQQQAGARVEVTTAEHAPVGLHAEGGVRQRTLLAPPGLLQLQPVSAAGCQREREVRDHHREQR